MADTQKQSLAKLQDDVGDLKTDVAVMKNELGYIKTSAEKMDKFIEDNKGGINLASVLNSKVTLAASGGMVAAALYFAAQAGGGQ